jgi:exonuclease III
MPHSFSAIGISETWLTDTMQDLVHISGYKFLSNHRTKKVGDGVGLYVQSDCEHRRIFSDPNLIESLFVEITVPNGKNVIIGTVYRPPNHNLVLFLEKFNQILFNISKSNKECYIMGDYNIDMFHLNEHSPTQ